MDNRTVMVEVMDVSKIYNASNQIKEINFAINKGECFALCGGNGAGKSTIIQMMIGTIKPTTGTIKVNSIPVSSKSPSYKSQFSYMPDAMAFPNVLTGYEVLRFFAKMSNAPLERVDKLLVKVGLENDKDKRVKDYSKGMQQRLALAQSLLPQAPFLILDEPTNGLDPYWVKQFKEIIREEKERGTTILFSSHILPDVEELADRVAFMNEGKLLLIDKVESLAATESLEDVFFELLSKKTQVAVPV